MGENCVKFGLKSPTAALWRSKAMFAAPQCGDIEADCGRNQHHDAKGQEAQHLSIDYLYCVLERPVPRRSTATFL